MSEQHVTFDAARAHDYELTIQVGDPGAPDGVTRMSLEGTGRFVAEQSFGDERGPDRATGGERIAGELPRAEAEGIMRQAARFPWGRAFPSRPGIPDEAIVVWHFHEKNKQGPTLKVWLREAESDPTQAPVLTSLRKGLAGFAKDRLYL